MLAYLLFAYIVFSALFTVPYIVRYLKTRKLEHYHPTEPMDIAFLQAKE